VAHKQPPAEKTEQIGEEIVETCWGRVLQRSVRQVLKKKDCRSVSGPGADAFLLRCWRRIGENAAAVAAAAAAATPLVRGKKPTILICIRVSGLFRFF